MLAKLSRTWTAFRALPWIFQFGAWLAFALVAVPAVVKAQDGDSIPVHVRATCEAGRLVGLEVFTPVPGVITIPIPPDVCQRQPQGDPQPTPRKPPLRTT